MIEAKTLINIAKKTGIHAERLERDYVMSLILDALSRCDETKDDIVFKGGCCVHKCFTLFEKSDNPKALDPYFTKGRFSSDIDLTISKKLMSTEALSHAFQKVSEYLNKEHGLVLEQMDFPMHFNEKQSKTNSRSTLHYQGPLYLYGLEQKKKKALSKGKPMPYFAPPELKIDITADEKVVYEPTLKPIYHPYPGDEKKEKNLQTRCYTLQGMFAEKIRSLFERCSPRDLYDLHILFNHPEIGKRKLEIGEAIIGKFRFKKIPLRIDEELLTKPQKAGEKPLKELCKEEWEHSLKQQIGELGNFDDYWDKDKFPKILRFAKECMNMALNAERQQQVIATKQQNVK